MAVKNEERRESRSNIDRSHIIKRVSFLGNIVMPRLANTCVVEITRPNCTARGLITLMGRTMGDLYGAIETPIKDTFSPLVLRQ